MRRNNANSAMKASWLLAFISTLIYGTPVLPASAEQSNFAVRSAKVVVESELPLALIKSISAATAIEPPPAAATVIRADHTSEAAETGMFLYRGDQLLTDNAQSTLLFLDDAAEKNNEVVVDVHTKIQIGSVFDWFGRIIIRVKGAFETRTEKVKLGVQGTEFEVVAAPNGDQIVVLEGVVTATSGSFGPSASHPSVELPGPMTAGLFRDSFAQVNALPPNGDRATQSKNEAWASHPRIAFSSFITRQDEPILVNKKEMTSVSTQGLTKREAPDQLIARAVTWSNEVIVQGHQSYTTQSITPSFPDAEARAQAFRKARLIAALSSDPLGYKQLGDALLDMGDGAKAIDAYEHMGKVRPTPDYLTKFAAANRLVGRFPEAEQLLLTALKQNSGWAPALNALGNVYRDLAAVERDKQNYTGAEGWLNKARVAYESVSVSGPSHHANRSKQYQGAAGPGIEKGIVQANLGEVYRALGDLAQDRKHSDEALAQYQKAEQVFQQAQESSPSYVFAHTGLGTVYREINKVAAAKGDKARAADAFKRSEAEYSMAYHQHVDLAAAYVGLGNLYENAGGKDAALKYYTKATRFRPEEPTGHYHLALLLRKDNQRLAAAHAFAYLRIERKPLLQGAKAKDLQDLVPIPKPDGSENPRWPKVPKVEGDTRERALRKLSDLGLKGETSVQAGCEPNGKALGTSPKRDERVAPGSTVIVYISGPGDQVVPAVASGRTRLPEAKQILEDAGFTVRVTRKEVDSIPENTVLEQRPVANTRSKSGCPVELTIAISLKLIEVPRFIDLPRDRALRLLPKFSLQLYRGAITEEESDRPAGTVINQNPDPHTMVHPGTAVDLVIAKPRKPSRNPG